MEDIILSVSEDLIAMDRRDGKISFQFPLYQNGEPESYRVSEQESKILFAKHLIERNIPFAIEVPTITKHSFSGEKKISGRHDIVTYKNNTNNEIDWVIELKAHIPKLQAIRKDFEKMVMAGKDGIWFHTLENENINSVSKLLERMKEALSSEIQNCERKNKWLISIVVIKTKRLLFREIEITKDMTIDIEDVEQYRITELP